MAGIPILSSGVTIQTIFGNNFYSNLLLLCVTLDLPLLFIAKV